MKPMLQTCIEANNSHGWILLQKRLVDINSTLKLFVDIILLQKLWVSIVSLIKHVVDILVTKTFGQYHLIPKTFC